MKNKKFMQFNKIGNLLISTKSFSGNIRKKKEQVWDFIPVHSAFYMYVKTIL